VRCKYCGSKKLSIIKVWEGEEGVTWHRLGCLSCGRKFDAAEKGIKSSKQPASKLSKYATR
jgi:transcriptional regulator NrdR family protein